nr:MAG TPA: hypothetical protein [Caudoviricetes sp.]
MLCCIQVPLGCLNVLVRYFVVLTGFCVVRLVQQLNQNLNQVHTFSKAPKGLLVKGAIIRPVISQGSGCWCSRGNRRLWRYRGLGSRRCAWCYRSLWCLWGRRGGRCRRCQALWRWDTTGEHLLQWGAFEVHRLHDVLLDEVLAGAIFLLAVDVQAIPSLLGRVVPQEHTHIIWVQLRQHDWFAGVRVELRQWAHGSVVDNVNHSTATGSVLVHRNNPGCAQLLRGVLDIASVVQAVKQLLEVGALRVEHWQIPGADTLLDAVWTVHDEADTGVQHRWLTSRLTFVGRDTLTVLYVLYKVAVVVTLRKQYILKATATTGLGHVHRLGSYSCVYQGVQVSQYVELGSHIITSSFRLNKIYVQMQGEPA